MTFRQAIETKYLGPTNYRGSRVKAWCAAGSITIGWDSALNSEDNHHAAALKLQVKCDWASKFSLIGGQLESGNYCFVQVRRGK